MRSRILLGTIFGAIGGFLGFLLQEMLVPHNAGLSMRASDMFRLGAMVGGMLGIAIGAVEGAAVGSPHRLLRGMVLGGIIGVVGGLFGVYFGSTAYNYALFGKDPEMLALQGGGILDFTHLVLARALGWTFLGAFPGLAAGAATFSWKRTWHGLAGGLLGGFVGGFIFDLVANLVAPIHQVTTAATEGPTVVEIGGPSRAIGFTTIGLLTGLFIGLVEEWLKQGWVRVLAGRNEGRDYILSKPLTVLGRDERADIPLFGDPALAPQHAAIRAENGRHVLLDGGTALGSIVNGQRVGPPQPQLLRDGDMIQLGQVRLLFREKATAAKVSRPAPDAPKSPAQAPGALAMPSHLCPFCGAPKDASGGCLCTVPGGGASPASYAPNGGMAPVGALDGGPAMQGAPLPAGVPAADGMGTQLMALEGVYAGQVFSLAARYITIGREPSNAVALTADSTISRRHAHISDEEGRHVLYDDGSSNGTFVNNVRISIQPLAPGDVIQLGASKFRYE